jgi:hypothetical protein
MKIQYLLTALLLPVIGMAQKTYTTTFTNEPGHTVVFNVGSEHMTVIGHDRNEIVIETDFRGAPASAPSAPKPGAPARASGLRPLTPSGSDNTDTGLMVEKTGKSFTVVNINGAALESRYTIRIPRKVNFTLNDNNPMMDKDVAINGLNGEITLNSLNGDFVLKSISGPVVAHVVNGDIEVHYDHLAPEKPNDFAAVNGFVDITLPSSAKVAVSLNTVNGEAFTDFDIKADDTNPPPHIAMPNFNVFSLEGKINGGSQPFTLSAVNGDVFIRKGK